MNAAQRTAIGKNIFNGLSSKFFSRSANVNRVSSQFRNADCALQQGSVMNPEKSLVGAHARTFSAGQYQCSHHGDSVTNYRGAAIASRLASSFAKWQILYDIALH